MTYVGKGGKGKIVGSFYEKLPDGQSLDHLVFLFDLWERKIICSPLLFSSLGYKPSVSRSRPIRTPGVYFKPIRGDISFTTPVLPYSINFSTSSKVLTPRKSETSCFNRYSRRGSDQIKYIEQSRSLLSFWFRFTC